MPNAVQRLWENDAHDPIAAVDGSFTLTFRGQTTPALPWNADVGSVIQPALEALSTIGTGNVVVSDLLDSNGHRVGLSFAFQGALANVAIEAITATSTLLQSANRVSITPVADGAATQTVTAVLSSTSSSGNTEQFLLDLTTCTTGSLTFALNASSAPYPYGGYGTWTLTVDSIDADNETQLQSDADTDYAPGVVTVAVLAPMQYLMTFHTPYNAVAIPAVISNDTDGTPLFSAYSSPIIQVDTLAFSPTPNDGSFTLTYGSASQSFPWNVSTATLQAWYQAVSAGTTVTGSVSSGFTVTFGDSNSYAGTISNDGGLQVDGTAQVVSFALLDAPTVGSVAISLGSTNATVPFNASASQIANATGWGCSGSGSSSNPWVLTAPAPASNVSITIVEDLVTPAPLEKSLAATVVIVNTGGPAASTRKRPCRHRTLRAG